MSDVFDEFPQISSCGAFGVHGIKLSYVCGCFAQGVQRCAQARYVRDTGITGGLPVVWGHWNQLSHGPQSWEMRKGGWKRSV